MRPLRLTMTAFGPFAGTEVVDFTTVLDTGIFGIYGETGAGKTTIFDGISFALFGESSGAERAAEDMVCHHAHARALTQVELVFDLGQDRYVVQRTPKQERPSFRGTGVTNEPHTAYLFRATGMALEDISGNHPGEIIAEKQVSRVDPEIRDILGYDAAQFRQIVLLPQGDFRKILTASSGERAPILKRLFDVQLYENFVERIKKLSDDTRRQIEDERVRLATVLGEQSEEELVESLDGLRTKIATLNVNLKADSDAFDKAQTAFSAGQNLAEKFTALSAARDEASKFTQKSEDIQKRKFRLERARAAQNVLGAESALHRSDKDVQDAQVQDEHARQTFTDAQTALTSAREALAQTAQQKDAREAAQVRVLELERLEKVLIEAHGLLGELNNAKNASVQAIEEEKSAKQRKAECEQSLSVLRNLQTEQSTHAQALQQATNTLTVLEREDAALKHYEAAISKRDQQAAKVAELQQKHEASRQHLEACKAARAATEQELTDIQAVHVARKLLPGQPCPACGSLDHPNPASGDPARLGRHDQFDQADRDYEAANADTIKAEAELNAAQTTLGEQQVELDDLATPERDREAFGPVLVAAHTAKMRLEADERFVDLENKIAAATNDVDVATAAYNQAAQALAHSGTLVAQKQSDYDAHLRDVPEDLRQEGGIAAALEAATSKRDQLARTHEDAEKAQQQAAINFSTAEESCRNSATNVVRTSGVFAAAQAEFTAQLSKVGLDESGFESAKHDIAQVDYMQGAINEFNEGVAANKAKIEGLTEEIGDQSAPDIAALSDAKEAAQAKMNQTQQEHARLKRDLETDLEKQKMIEGIAASIRSLEKKYGPLGELADIVNGKNDRKVRLPDFAIAAMFDEVLVAANHRLEPMTSGRYQLLRPTDAGSGNQKRGLDIEVFDANTEKSRPTQTLSGGEGFQASLALALGLSDVVQRNSGGIKLDTIFIDEGFGTLDEATLDNAIDTLNKLTGEKRAVGVISHTEQVKAMITDGFDVKRTASGSHIETRHITT